MQLYYTLSGRQGLRPQLSCAARPTLFHPLTRRAYISSLSEAVDVDKSMGGRGLVLNRSTTERALELP
eukprot:1178029-Prorocentrum_minimum.AAC.1